MNLYSCQVIHVKAQSKYQAATLELCLSVHWQSAEGQGWSESQHGLLLQFGAVCFFPLFLKLPFKTVVNTAVLLDSW